MEQRIYRSLYRIRRVEEEIARLYPSDRIKSPVHLSIGQEAVSVGVCEALDASDVVFGTYRSHALYLAKGGDLRRMMAELYGKATGCAGGKGGSMHLIDVGAGVMGASAVVATTIPQAVGYAYAFRLRREPALVVSIFGDGAVEEGVFHESMNFAALHRLPILFVCENNLYAIHSHVRDRQAIASIADFARGYGMPSERVEDGEVHDILAATRRAVEAIRRGEGPRFLECLTYRWREHVGPGEDFEAGYRARTEAAIWMERDPVAREGARLGPAERQTIETEVEAEIAAAVAFAERSPVPTTASLWADV